MTLQRIVVGVDGSPASIGAVRAAMELVAPTGELRLVRVVETSLARRAIDLVLSAGLPQAARAQRALRAASSLAQLAAVIGAQSRARVDTCVLEGAVAGSLLQACAERDGELIVVGDRRPRPLRRLALGGVVRRLVQRSHAPLLVVPEFAVLHRVRCALMLGPAPPSQDEQDQVMRTLGPLRPTLEFMATGLGPARGLDQTLRALSSRTVLVVPQRAAQQDLGATWVLDHAPGPVLFVPTANVAAGGHDALAASAAWHGDVPRGATDTERGEETTPASREGLRAEARTT